MAKKLIFVEKKAIAGVFLYPENDLAHKLVNKENGVIRRPTLTQKQKEVLEELGLVFQIKPLEVEA